MKKRSKKRRGVRLALLPRGSPRLLSLAELLLRRTTLCQQAALVELLSTSRPPR